MKRGVKIRKGKVATSAPVGGDEQEVVLARYRREHNWTVSVSDTKFQRLLERRGYAPVSDDGFAYKVYKIPTAAVTIRRPSSIGKAGRGAAKKKGEGTA